MELEKLSEESLTRQPEEVFDILCKLGEGSYGSVFKALHKESKQILAIKQVPVDTDLQEIIKEISIMQQCDSPYVVKYYGSYFKNTDLWIVMEYCGAGSVLDIMKLRGIYHSLPKGIVKTLNEDEIATVLSDTLKGLEYLHLRKKIHRDVKAGNILLNSEGHAKLADFGVAGQLTDTMAKRNTVIGTPFWMAPEVIQEIGYDCAADIWSLGITALEMAEGKAPYGDIHPMRAIFMIPSKPPPSFSEPDKWSSAFIDFVSRCLVKNPVERASSSELLQHEFIVNAKTSEILQSMIREAQMTRDELQERNLSNSEDSGTIVPDDSGDESGTMIQHSTLVSNQKTATSELESNLGTMVINDDAEEEESETMKRHATGPSSHYRPAFLDHFDKSGEAQKKIGGNAEQAQAQLPAPSAPPAPATTSAEQAGFEHQFAQIAGRQSVFRPMSNSSHSGHVGGDPGRLDPEKIQKCIAEGDFDVLKFLALDELTDRMGRLDQEMEREIDELRMRYHAKRQPILDAIDQKRKRQQNF